MNYNYREEYKKWYAWKEKEEKILREHGVPQSKIDELREYDYDQFKAERRYRTHHLFFDENYFINRSAKDKKIFSSLDDILNSIENEALYEHLKNTDRIGLEIIRLKMLGYTVKEISQITGLTTHQIYKKIKKLRKNL